MNVTFLIIGSTTTSFANSRRVSHDYREIDRSVVTTFKDIFYNGNQISLAVNGDFEINEETQRHPGIVAISMSALPISMAVDDYSFWTI